MKLLIIRVSAIGDAIHTLPALFYLKKRIPNASISWVIQEKVASLLLDQPFIDTLHVLPNNFLKPKNWNKTKAIIKQLRQEHWDAIIDFQGLCKTSFLIWWLKGQKFGFDTNNAREKISTLFTHHHVTPSYTNIIQKNLALASEVLTYKTPQNSCPTIGQLQKWFKFFIPNHKKNIVREWLKNKNLLNFVTLAPNTTWPSKHWPIDHWKELLNLLTQTGVHTVLLGKTYGQTTAQLADYSTKKNLPIVVAPKWDLTTIAYLLQKTNLLVAPDTGILHLADFLETKTIGLFGPTLASQHGPFLTKENITNAIQIPCLHHYKKKHGTTNCMAQLTPDGLFKSIITKVFSPECKPYIQNPLFCYNDHKSTNHIKNRNNFMKKFFVFFMLLMFSCCYPQPELVVKKVEPIKAVQEEIPTLSIEKAVSEALTKKPSIHAYTYAIKGYERTRKTTLSSYLPNISLSETFYNSKNTSFLKRSFAIQAKQTLINLATRDNYRMATATVSSAHHQKESHKDAIRLATETAFLNSWLLQQKINLIVLLYQSTKDEFEKAKTEHTVNLLNKNDWLKSNATYSQNLAAVNSYRDDAAQAEETLNYYTGDSVSLVPSNLKDAPPLIKLTWDPHQTITAKKLSYYYQKALDNRKDIKIKQDEIDLEAYTSQYYAKQYVPTVSTFVDASKNTVRQGNSTWSKSAGISVGWNVFDGLSNYFNKSAADARKMKTVLEKNDLIRKVKLEVQQAHSALQKEIKNLTSQNVSYAQSENEYLLRKQEFDAGLISKVTFQTAQYTYENARFAWLNQVATTTLKHYELLYTCGYPPEV